MAVHLYRGRKVKCQNHQADWNHNRKSAISSEPEGLPTSSMVYGWSTVTHHRHTPWRPAWKLWVAVQVATYRGRGRIVCRPHYRPHSLLNPKSAEEVMFLPLCVCLSVVSRTQNAIAVGEFWDENFWRSGMCNWQQLVRFWSWPGSLCGYGNFLKEFLQCGIRPVWNCIQGGLWAGLHSAGAFIPVVGLCEPTSTLTNKTNVCRNL